MTKGMSVSSYSGGDLFEIGVVISKGYYPTGVPLFRHLDRQRMIREFQTDDQIQVPCPECHGYCHKQYSGIIVISAGIVRKPFFKHNYLYRRTPPITNGGVLFSRYGYYFCDNNLRYRL